MQGGPIFSHRRQVVLEERVSGDRYFYLVYKVPGYNKLFLMPSMEGTTAAIEILYTRIGVGRKAHSRALTNQTPRTNFASSLKTSRLTLSK